MNFGKSALTPWKTVEHLGFIWDSNKMLVSFPETKVDTTVSKAKRALREGGMTGGNLSSLLGLLESHRLAVYSSNIPVEPCALKKRMGDGTLGAEEE